MKMKTIQLLREPAFHARYNAYKVTDFDGEHFPIEKGDQIEIRNRIGKGLGLFTVASLDYSALELRGEGRNEGKKYFIRNGYKIQMVLFGS